ncbi:MAG: acyltransferase [Ilumatobacteraceae bacterium]
MTRTMAMDGADSVRHINAIDGLRAVAVIAVLAFHADLGLASGGFLGVSLFFTLSGYLITTLLLREHDTDGTISIRRFYARRWRRLIPSAWICIAGVLAAWLVWSASQRSALPGDALSALGNVANWRFAFSERSYQDLFIGRPSPLAHFWSLAIEEQFYAVMPLIAMICLRRSRRMLALVVGALLVVSVAANVLTADRDLVYNGTHTRAAELLIGVLLAISAPRIGRALSSTLGWVALAGFGVLVATTSVTSAWLYNGGLPAFSVISAALVLAAIATQGSSLTTLLELRPLVAIGRWSYALYLVHWPIYLALDPERTGLTRWPLLVLRTSISLTVAALITALIERPIRARRVFVRPKAGLIASLGAAACIAVVAISLPSPTFSDNEMLLAAGEEGVISFGDPATSVVPTASRRRVLVVGSDAEVPRLLRARGIDVVDLTDAKCPLTPAVEVQLVTYEVVATAHCTGSEAWFDAAREAGVADVILAFGAIDEGLVRELAEVGFPSRQDLPELAQRWSHFSDAVRALWERVPAGITVHMLRVGDESTTLRSVLVNLMASRGVLADLHFSVGSIAEALAAKSSVGDDGVRVLVLGDSTSTILAAAIHRAGLGRVDVLWLGSNGCPVVPIDAFRSAEHVDWQEVDCPSKLDVLAGQLETFRPDVVLLMVSGVELAHQRYPGDDRDHVAGDIEYGAAHDDYMSTLTALLSVSEVPLLIADCPQLGQSPFLGEESASPNRIAAWNAQVHRWISNSTNVALLPYAAAINSREQTNAREHVLVDGIHPDLNILTEIVSTQLLDLILAAALR